MKNIFIIISTSLILELVGCSKDEAKQANKTLADPIAYDA
jgi:hypothetical protein